MKTIYLIIQVFNDTYDNKTTRNAIYAVESKEEALDDCKRLQQRDTESFTYEIQEINLYI